ncbi:MAG: EpsI family protein [Verrucomicrobia bacterium]|nr:EpsI family protein [Verrucomicrobiota bacterium]
MSISSSSLSPLARRLFIVVGICAVGLGAVAVLPHRPGGQPGIRLELPDTVGSWDGKDAEVTQKEREVLGSDVEFARKVYTNTFGDQIYVSIVLAGFDPTQGIHRPERCLPAQGWSIARSAQGWVRLPNGGAIDTTQLFSARQVTTPKGDKLTQRSFSYYWFVGAREVTGNHLRRTFIDMRDRVLRGESQRWAYVTVAANVTKDYYKFGRNEEETRKMIEEFIPRIAPSFQLVGLGNTIAAR